MTTDATRPGSTFPAGPPPRWWRFGMVWFVLAGPALVIVAGFATMAIAFAHADVELHEPTPVAAFSIRVGAESRLPIPRLSAGAGDAAAEPPRTAAP
jgi:hypothetical protein